MGDSSCVSTCKNDFYSIARAVNLFFPTKLTFLFSSLSLSLSSWLDSSSDSNVSSLMFWLETLDQFFYLVTYFIVTYRSLICWYLFRVYKSVRARVVAVEKRHLEDETDKKIYDFLSKKQSSDKKLEKWSNLWHSIDK